MMDIVDILQCPNAVYASHFKLVSSTVNF